MYFAIFSRPESSSDSGQTILKVYESDESEKCLEVPVTPNTICQDVISCVSAREESYLAQIWNGEERALENHENLYAVLRGWEGYRDEVKFVIRDQAPPEIPPYPAEELLAQSYPTKEHRAQYPQHNLYHGTCYPTQNGHDFIEDNSYEEHRNEIPFQAYSTARGDYMEEEEAPPLIHMAGGSNSEMWSQPTHTDSNGSTLSDSSTVGYDERNIHGQRTYSRNGMEEDSNVRNGLPGGVDLTLSELQDMAARQQQQIENQQQILVAKEQRLKYLKQQDQRQQHIIAENDRLRKLRDRVETQEMKLKKLRALRGEVDKHKNSNGTLNTELESVKALFTEKEKELVMAVAKVEELTRQLEAIQKERANARNGTQNAAALELEKLRKELMIRNKLNEQQSTKLNKHREMLNQRKEEVAKMDNRIHELQQRLKKKRAQQAENVKNLDNKRLDANHNNRASNVAAVEPYVQFSPADLNKNDIDLKSSFAKQDPKYQTLPPNTKFISPEKGDNKINEQNNNISRHTESRPHSRTHKTDNTNSNALSSQLSESVIKAAQRHVAPPPGQPAKPPPPSSTQSSKPPPPPRSANTGLTYFTPRPYGSTYSTSVLANRARDPSVVNGPTINVQEEIRQGGSGQSSPASSDGSQNSKHNEITQQVTKDNHHTSSSNGAPIPRRQPPPPPVDSAQHKNGSVDHVDSSKTENHNKVPNKDNNGMSEGKLKHSAESNGANATRTINFASKNQIANTYMGRLGPESLQKYQKNMNMLYKNLAKEESDKTPDSDSKGNKKESSENMIINTDPHKNGQQETAAPHSPPHTDIASDKISHNRNTPKTIRRRHSDSSDNEDITKLLHKYVDRHNDRNIALNNTQATSFIGDIPENVPVDSMGNLVDVHEKEDKMDKIPKPPEVVSEVVPRKKTNLRKQNSKGSGNRVSFDPLALLLDASLEGELDMVKRCASKVQNVSEPNDEGITALHNAICAGHYEIVKFLVEFGCDVNSPDSDGWTPLHCAASCNNLPMVIFLVEHGACIFATTISDQETAAEKCEEDEDGFDGCSEYLYSIQEKLGILNGGVVYAVFDYDAKQEDELSFKMGDDITVLRKGDEVEKEWWWSQTKNSTGYVPRNLLGLYPRVLPHNKENES